MKKKTYKNKTKYHRSTIYVDKELWRAFIKKAKEAELSASCILSLWMSRFIDQ